MFIFLLKTFKTQYPEPYQDIDPRVRKGHTSIDYRGPVCCPL